MTFLSSRKLYEGSFFWYCGKKCFVINASFGRDVADAKETFLKKLAAAASSAEERKDYLHDAKKDHKRTFHAVMLDGRNRWKSRILVSTLTVSIIFLPHLFIS